MPLGLAKNLEYPNRKGSVSLGSVGREPLMLERVVTSSVFQGSSFAEGNSTWRQSIISFAARRIAFGLSFAISSPGTLKVIRVREGGTTFAPGTWHLCIVFIEVWVIFLKSIFMDLFEEVERVGRGGVGGRHDKKGECRAVLVLLDVIG